MELTLTRPDDWHLHLRDDAALLTTVPDTARTFHRAIVMPNLKPPVTTVEAAIGYRERILDALPSGMSFDPLMTLYLAPELSPSTIREAVASARAEDDGRLALQVGVVERRAARDRRHRLEPGDLWERIPLGESSRCAGVDYVFLFSIVVVHRWYNK